MQFNRLRTFLPRPRASSSGQTQTFPDGTACGEFREGGTSLSSPLFAGIMADADQALGTPHGFANLGAVRTTT